MIAVALLLAAATSLPVVDEVVHVPPGNVQAVNLTLQKEEAVIEVSFAVVAGASEINVALVGPGDGIFSRKGAPHQYLRLLPGQQDGTFRFPATVHGDYQVILDNRGQDRREVAVKLHVALTFGEAAALRPRTLSRERKLAVVCLSLLFFGGVALYSGRRLVSAMRKRTRDEQTRLF